MEHPVHGGTSGPQRDIWIPVGHPDPNGTATPSEAHPLPGQEGAIEVAEAGDVLRGARRGGQRGGGAAAGGGGGRGCSSGTGDVLTRVPHLHPQPAGWRSQGSCWGRHAQPPSPHTHPRAASSSSSSSSSPFSSSWAHWLSSLAEGGGGSSSVQLTTGGFTACPSFALAPVPRRDAGGAVGRAPHHEHPRVPPPIRPPYRAQPGHGAPGRLQHPLAGNPPQGRRSHTVRRDGGMCRAPHCQPRWCCKPAPRQPPLQTAPSGRCNG